MIRLTEHDAVGALNPVLVDPSDISSVRVATMDPGHRTAIYFKSQAPAILVEETVEQVAGIMEKENQK